MAFAIVAVTLVATCLQSSYAAVAIAETSTASSTTTVGPTVTAPAVSSLGIMSPANAVNSLNPVNHLYNSPYIPNSQYYGVDLLNDFPYFLPCDCDFSGLIDPTLIGEIGIITTRYNQRPCSVQQWERLISINMPGIDAVNSLNMLSSLASALQREQIRYNLAYGNFPEVCLNYAQALENYATTTTATSSSAVNTILARREPHQVATATASSTTTTVTSAKAPWNDTPYMYTMQYLFDRALPNLSADLRLDIINAVLANTPPAQWNMANTLAQQLTANIRGMVSDMVDLSLRSVAMTY